MHQRRWLILLLTTGLLLMAACGGGDGGGGEAETGGGEVAGDPARGEELYMMTTIADTGAPGCITCHSVEPKDEPLQPSPVGPSHYGVADRAADYVEGMSAEEYLRESIVQPNAHVVKGFNENIMYQNYAEDLTEQQINDLVAYLMTLSAE